MAFINHKFIAATSVTLLGISLVLFSLTSNARAGVGLLCNGLNGSKAEIAIALGGGVGFSALNASGFDGKTNFTTKTDDAIATGTIIFQLAQGMQLGDAYYADFSDQNAEKILVSLRVNIDLLDKSQYAKMDTEDTMAGRLTFSNQKPIAVSCTLG